ncbi:carboxymuconolactone decarboxylase family protein [Actinomadura madurae]|uniref:carboxymuconolactone decarboxylase family protein n=1 Tax=Actinomadura madurae TaxID=1993 RepID=UPI0020270CD5|nr:carboxymuconolactone decarboxylase family protein [Actinomadura madurae]MCP9966218.1 carboxymuconolactone decarboxylase family protein [Actinomadura madurae]MCQ0009770.1 carboxymuconolactone decarboxylase family protein [Actinomadura madurae]URM95007.1 carboxymuconolactone decarboxylase family protein [Actinomadura madurae]
MPRIAPLDPPYSPEIATALAKWMPPNVTHDPLVLFRTLHRAPELASRMRVLGAGLLAHGSLPARDREIVIHRTCARAGCEYEWGVHAATFGEATGLGPEQIEATVSGASAPWSPREWLLISAVDELHDSAQISQPTWDALTVHYDEPQLLELLVLAGWYRTIGQLINTLELDNEPWAHPFPTPPT